MWFSHFQLEAIRPTQTWSIGSISGIFDLPKACLNSLQHLMPRTSQKLCAAVQCLIFQELASWGNCFLEPRSIALLNANGSQVHQSQDVSGRRSVLTSMDLQGLNSSVHMSFVNAFWAQVSQQIGGCLFGCSDPGGNDSNVEEQDGGCQLGNRLVSDGNSQ